MAKQLIKHALFTTHIVHTMFIFKTTDVFPTNHVALAVRVTLGDPEWRHVSCSAKAGQGEGLVPYRALRQETSGVNGKGNARKSSYAFHLLSLSSDVQHRKSGSKAFTLLHTKGVTGGDTVASTMSCFSLHDLLMSLGGVPLNTKQAGFR